MTLLPFPGVELPAERTCFQCLWYIEASARCVMFGEQIDSEIYAAQDCDAYEVDRGRR